MRRMHCLRHFPHITRLVLAWFVLALGVAMASPIVRPQNILLICSGSGAMQVLVQADDGGVGQSASIGMDCPLCATMGAPPPVASVGLGPLQSLSHALQGRPAAHIAARAAAPFPARGPPASD